MSWIQFYSREKTKRLFYLYSPNKFFNVGEEIITKITKDYIKFVKPSLSYTGKTNVVSKPPNWEGIHKLNFISDVDIPLNTKFYADEEESDEDVIVVYFNKKEE
jgi:hypothetical protein